MSLEVTYPPGTVWRKKHRDYVQHGYRDGDSYVIFTHWSNSDKFVKEETFQSKLQQEQNARRAKREG